MVYRYVDGDSYSGGFEVPGGFEIRPYVRLQNAASGAFVGRFMWVGIHAQRRIYPLRYEWITFGGCMGLR
jgi:hypothetical protein